MATTANTNHVGQREETRNETEEHSTLEPEQARQATRGNGIWIILTVSTGLAITVLLILFGGAVG